MSRTASILAVSLFVFCLSLTASAAVYTVTKTADTNDGACDADCSLREAVAAANATKDDDTIEFSAIFGSPQTITLSGTEIIFLPNGSLTVNGPGPELLTISGNNVSRIFASHGGAIVNINSLRFTAGNGAGETNSGRGGAIYNSGGTMVITNSILTGNTAANGGAINNAGWTPTTPDIPGNLTIIGCAITNNISSSSGGAMQNFGGSTLNLINTTVANNTSNGTGIAGAFQANGTVTITNSTFSGNNAPTGTSGGVYYNGTTGLTMTNTTIVNNSSLNGAGGLHRTGTTAAVNIRNTIVANNNGTAANPDAFGLVSSQGTNIIGNNAGSTGWVASDFQNVNPMLGALTANGGLGNTHLPQSGSPAIDAGQNCVVDLICPIGNPPVAVTTDQRGIARPQNAIVDIGAVEVAGAAAAATITGQVLSPDSTPIRNAIVTISNMSGVVASARTNSFGRFTLNNIPPASGYTLNVIAKQYTFIPQNIDVTGDLTGIIIAATSGNLSESKY